MDEVDIRPINDNPSVAEMLEPTEQVQTHKVNNNLSNELGDKALEINVEHPKENKKEEKKRGRGRPVTTGSNIRKTKEKHVMTQKRLDALARARQKRMENLKARRILEAQQKEEEEALKVVGRMIVNNTTLAQLEHKDNLQVEAGKVDSKLGNMIQPIVPSAHKNSHMTIATVGTEYNQPKPNEPVSTVINFDNGGVYQKQMKKDLTFTL